MSSFTLQVTEISLINTNHLYIKARIAQTSQCMQLEILMVLSAIIQGAESLQCVFLRKTRKQKENENWSGSLSTLKTQSNNKKLIP